jgi:hypothetical protein
MSREKRHNGSYLTGRFLGYFMSLFQLQMLYSIEYHDDNVWLIRNNVRESGGSLFNGNISAFNWRGWEKTRNKYCRSPRRYLNTAIHVYEAGMLITQP